METSRFVVIGIYALLGLYLLYKLFFDKNRPHGDYEKLYNEILHSKKYRVKGQFDKEE